MRTITLFVLALTLSHTAFAQSAEKFDLACRGFEKTISSGKETSEVWSSRFRIDLSKSVYCYGECKRPIPITRLEAGLIVLREVEPTADFPTDSMVVNRANGKLLALLETSRPSLESIQADCELAPFTPMPKMLF